MPGAELIWPIAKGVAAVAIVLGLAAMVLRMARERGKAETAAELEHDLGVRNDKAAEIMAEPIGDASSWLDRLRRKRPRDT